MTDTRINPAFGRVAATLGVSPAETGGIVRTMSVLGLCQEGETP